MDAGFQLPAASAPGMLQLESFAPTTGQTVQSLSTAMIGLVNIQPAGTLAALTVNLPTEATSFIGQIVRIAFFKAITALTIAGPTTVYNAPSSAAIGDNIGFQKTSANTWSRLV